MIRVSEFRLTNADKLQNMLNDLEKKFGADVDVQILPKTIAPAKDGKLRIDEVFVIQKDKRMPPTFL